ncbi:hypothetical protein AAFF_G00388040 [Aldrovandia affinis]|uniref:Uncharacterized protein n=1 Tax=Aldrovandia affinis TaxID=143900 RepID=A0AAD7SEQ3_9TELE|nr:hypothetical protein AAFF_G00388040 [Aldrovandia affinis]
MINQAPASRQIACGRFRASREAREIAGDYGPRILTRRRQCALNTGSFLWTSANNPLFYRGGRTRPGLSVQKGYVGFVTIRRLPPGLQLSALLLDEQSRS